jgi:hypothetical protein
MMSVKEVVNEGLECAQVTRCSAASRLQIQLISSRAISYQHHCQLRSDGEVIAEEMEKGAEFSINLCDHNATV